MRGPACAQLLTPVLGHRNHEEQPKLYTSGHVRHSWRKSTYAWPGQARHSPWFVLSFGCTCHLAQAPNALLHSGGLMLAHESLCPTRTSTCCRSCCLHQGLCLPAYGLTATHSTCRESGGQHVSKQQNGRSHRFDSPDRHRRGTRKGRSPSPRSRGHSRDRPHGSRPASPDRKRRRSRSPERNRHKSDKSRERGRDRRWRDSSRRGGQGHDRRRQHDGASKPGASSPNGGHKQGRQNGLEGRQSRGSALQSAKQGSAEPLKGAVLGNNFQNDCFQHSQGRASSGSDIHSKGSQRDGTGQPLDAHHGAAEGPSGKQTKQARPEVAEGSAHDGRDQPEAPSEAQQGAAEGLSGKQMKQAWPERVGSSAHGRSGQPEAPSNTHQGAAEGPAAKGMQQAWPEVAEGRACDGPGQPEAPSEAQYEVAEGLSGKWTHQAWQNEAGAGAAPGVGQPAASLGSRQMSGISDEQLEGGLACKGLQRSSCGHQGCNRAALPKHC